MPDIWMDVDAALSEVPVNLMPLVDDGDFKTIEGGVAYNAAGMTLRWHFVTTAGAYTVTSVTPTTGGTYDWTDQGDSGIYTIEIPATGGASINNDTEGFGWFTGVATGVLPWRGPVIGFRDAALNNMLIDSAMNANRGLAGTALPDALPRAIGGVCDVWGAAGTAWNSGAIGASTLATDAITSTQLAASAVSEIWAAVADSAGTTTLLSRLSSTRAGYLDNLSAGAVALAANLTGDPYAYLTTNMGLLGANLTAADDAVMTRIGAAGAGLTALGDTRIANLDAAISTRMATFTLPTNFSSLGINASGHVSRVTLVDTATNLTNLPTMPTDWLTSNGLAASAVSEIQSGLSTHSDADVWAVATRVLTAGTNIALAKGTGVTGFNDLDSSGVRSAVGLASANLDSQFGSLATAASIAALNNVSSAQVLAQVETAINSTTRSMPGQATPSTTPTLAAAIMQMFQQATNPSDQDSSKYQLYDRSGVTVQQKRTVADNGTLFQLGALVTGP